MKLYASLISYSVVSLVSRVLRIISMRTNLGNPDAEYPAGDRVRNIARAANARMIVHHLALPIPSSLPQRATYTSHVRRNRKSRARLLHGRLVIPLIAVDPGAIQATYDTFAFNGHCVQRVKPVGKCYGAACNVQCMTDLLSDRRWSSEGEESLRG